MDLTIQLSADSGVHKALGDVPEPFSLFFMVQNAQGRTLRYVGSSQELVPYNNVQNSESRILSLHNHPHYELIYVLDGELTQHMEKGIFKYRSGDVCILNRNVKHFEGNETAFTVICMNLFPEFVDGLYMTRGNIHQYHKGAISSFFYANNHTEAKMDQEYLDFSYTVSQFENKRKAKTLEILDQIADELIQVKTGFFFRIQALLLLFFEELENSKYYHLSRVKVDATTEEFIMTRVRQYMKECKGHLTRKELSALLHYNGSYLNSIVKKQSGMTITQLSQKLRLHEAKVLLKETTTPITEIIQELGFMNRTYFYEIFRKETGMTPLQYRQQGQ